MPVKQFTEYENGKAILKYRFTERELNEYRDMLWDFLNRIHFEKLPELIYQLKRIEVDHYDDIRNKMPDSQEIHNVTSKLAEIFNNFNRSPFASREHNGAIAGPYYVVSGPLNQYFNIDTYVALLKKLYGLIEDRVAALEHRDASTRDSLRSRQQIMLKDESDALMDFHGGTATFDFWLGVVLLITVLVAQKERIDAGKGMVQQQLSRINISVNQESALAILLSPLLLIIGIFAMMLKNHVRSLVEKDMNETLVKLRSVQDTLDDRLKFNIVNVVYDTLNLDWTTGTSKYFSSRQKEVLYHFAGVQISNSPKLITQDRNTIFAVQGGKSQGHDVVIEEVEDLKPSRPT